MHPHRNLIILQLSLISTSLLFAFSAASAQDTQAKYQRKSISYIDAIQRLGSDVQLRKEQESYLLKAIRQEIEMSRFDYNPLPEALLTQFKHEMASRRIRSLDDLTEAINQILVPEIMRIVDYEKEMRALDLVSEADRHSFVVEKAKETGITADDLEAIMNSAYIYVPVISAVSIHEDEKRNTATGNLKGGILWFAIKPEESGTRVELLVKKETEGSGFAKLDGKFSYEGRMLSGPQYAFVTAAKTFARNLKVATQEIPEFQLTNPLTAAGSGWVEFPMGKKEGLGVDDKFIIAEYYQEKDGSLTQEKLGMARVSKVADNREQPASSRARTVIGSGYERGMLALEHPRLPVDLSFRLAMLPIGVDENTDHPELYFDTDASANLYTGQLWFNYNLAGSTNLSQFFVSLYGEIGGGTLKGGTASGEDLPTGFYWGAGLGLVKKFYVNRLHLGLEALGSYANYRFSGTNASEEDWQWQIANLGLTLNGNLEIAVGYDLNLGGGVSYRLFAPSDNWTYSLGGDEQDLSTWQNVPELKLAGLGFQLYLTWSLPSLTYDPLAAARGAIGH